MPDETIDELKAGWEAVREKIVALQKSNDFYRERNEHLVDLNRALEAKLLLMERQYQLCQESLDNRDELLWWVTALANVHRPNGIPWEHYVGLLLPLHKILATQGYAREGLEKR